jgi:hypothetical protein
LKDHIEALKSESLELPGEVKKFNFSFKQHIAIEEAKIKEILSDRR